MIVDYLKEVVSKLDESRECGFCWVFSAPLEDQTGNIRQVRDDECECAHLYLTRLNISESHSFGSVFHSVLEKRKSYNITFFVMLEAELSENNWDEIPNHPIEESRWVKYLKPLADCLTINNFNHGCKVLGYPIRFTSWNAECLPNPNIYDRNFVGYRVSATIEKQIL